MTFNDWTKHLGADPMPWLLEEDLENPGVRYFALTELLGKEIDDPEVAMAQKAVMEHGPVPVVLTAQQKGGYWEIPGEGYYPKYRGTVWQITFLAQLGADGKDPRVRKGCEYVLEHSRDKEFGGFSMNGKRSGFIHCLQGNLCAALIDLGWLGDDRLGGAIDWLARSVTGEGISPAVEKDATVRYLRSGNSAPGFCCSANDHQPCAWGAVKALLALGKVPEERRSASIRAAIEMGVEFLFSRNPAAADYPMGYSAKPNRSWFQFGYPIAYVTDVLQTMEVLTAFGYGRDVRLKPAVELLLEKHVDGRWKMEYTYNGKIWADIEEKKQPSKWVTLRAMRVLKDVFDV